MSRFNAIGLGLTNDRGQVAIMTQKIASRSRNAIFIDKIRMSAILPPVAPVGPGGPKLLAHYVRGVGRVHRIFARETCWFRGVEVCLQVSAALESRVAQAMLPEDAEFEQNEGFPSHPCSDEG